MTNPNIFILQSEPRYIPDGVTIPEKPVKAKKYNCDTVCATGSRDCDCAKTDMFYDMSMDQWTAEVLRLTVEIPSEDDRIAVNNEIWRWITNDLVKRNASPNEVPEQIPDGPYSLPGLKVEVEEQIRQKGSSNWISARMYSRQGQRTATPKNWESRRICSLVKEPEKGPVKTPPRMAAHESNTPLLGTGSKFYNHKGTILYGRGWPKYPEPKASIYADETAMRSFDKMMEHLLQPQYQVKVTNPEILPQIDDGEFWPTDGYDFHIDSAKNTCTILISSTRGEEKEPRMSYDAFLKKKLSYYPEYPNLDRVPGHIAFAWGGEFSQMLTPPTESQELNIDEFLTFIGIEYGKTFSEDIARRIRLFKSTRNPKQ